MALKQSGVQLIAGGANKFISDMNKAAQTMLHYGATGQRLASLSETASARITRANDAINRSEKLRSYYLDLATMAEGRHLDLLAKHPTWRKKISIAARENAEALQAVTTIEHEMELQEISLAAAEDRLAAAQTRETANLLARYSALVQVTAAAVKQADVVGGLGALIGTAIGGPGMGTAIGAQIGTFIGDFIKQVGVLGTVARVALMPVFTILSMIKTGFMILFAPVGLLISGLQKLGGAILQLLPIIGQLAAGLFKVLGALVDIATAIVGKVIGAIKGLINGVTNLIGKLLSPLTDFAKGVLQIFSGLSLYNIVRNIVNQISQMSTEMLNALSIFQRFRIQMEALIASDVSEQFGIPMANAMKMVGDEAQVALDWIVQLAVTTPFTAVDISSTLALATAMGLSVKQAQELTVAIGNFTAGMGLTSENMYRIVYSMGQMISVGKLSAREFRDLANNMVPSYQILDSMADKAGKARGEFRKLAMEGGVPVMDFLEAFVEYSNTSFGDAMQRMSRTWEGVSSNMKDFLQDVIGLQVFGPIFDKITAMMANGLDRLMKPDIREAAGRIGRTLSMAFDAIVKAWPSVQAALSGLARALGFPDLKNFNLEDFVTNLLAGVVAGIEHVTGIIQKLSGQFNLNWSVMAADAYKWGSTLITQFAQGMVDALAAVAAAIAAIVNYIAEMLRAMSPPKALPDIREWGAAAMTEYMEGWTEGDFSVFNDIAGTIEKYLRSLGDEIPETNLVPLILNMRLTVSEAISEIRRLGDVTTATMDKIMESAQYLPENFRAFINALFDVERATKAVSDAQKASEAAQSSLKDRQEELNDITDRYSAILDNLNKQLDRNQEVYDEGVRLKEIDAAIATGLLTSEERERLEVEKRDIALKAQIRTVEDQRDAEVEAQQAKVDAAQMAYDLTEAQVVSAQKQLDAAKSALEAQKAFIGVQVDNNDLVQEQIDLLERLAEAAKRAAGAAAAAFDDLGVKVKDTGDLIEGELTRWEKKYGEFGDTGDIVQSKWDAAMINSRKAVDEFFAGAQKKIDETKANLEKIFEPLTKPGGSIDQVKKALGGLWDAFNRPEHPGVAGGANVEVNPLQRLLDDLQKNIVKWGSETLSAIFADMTKGTGDLVGSALLSAGANITKSLAYILLGPAGGTSAVEILTAFGERLFAILSLYTLGPNGAKSAIEVFEEFKKKLVTQSVVPETFDEVNTVISTKMDVVVATIGEKVDAMLKVFTDKQIFFFDAGMESIFQVDAGARWATDMVTGLLAGVQKIVDDMIAIFYTRANTDKFYNVGKDMVLGIAAGLSDSGAWSVLYNKIIKIVNDAIQAARDAAGEKSPSKRTEEIGKNLGLGLALGIQRSASVVRASLSNMVGGGLVSAASSVNTTNIDRSVHIEVNPSYKNYQSSAGVYYDVVAALAAAGR